ncbi:MAG: META domain-containing protein [Bacteroidota bacterium]
MDTNPNESNPDDFNFDDTSPTNKDPNPNPGDPNSSKRNSNLAITIVIVAGIILGAVLLTNRPAEDAAPVAPGAGTLVAVQPMATPPTAMPTSDRPTSVPVTIPPVPTATVQVTVPPQTTNPIQGINWQWDSVTDNSTGQTTGVPVPAQYTIAFNSNGTVNGLADCNSFTGTYSQTNGLTIKITSMTRAACPDGSLDQQYIDLLSNVASGGPDGSGNLALETAGGAQRMLFQNGGPAQ